MQNLPPDILSAAVILWNYHQIHHALKPCDVMFVLGSYDLRVPAYAAELYHKGLTPLIVCTGGIAHTDDLLATGWDKSEADIFASEMIAKHVPADIIIREERSTNTELNYVYSRELLTVKNIDFQSVLVVTKPFMERRAMATADIRLADKDVVITSPPLTMEQYFSGSNKGPATEIAVMVGDLQRFKLYPAKGFMSVQVIPDDVWQAFEYLVEHGFTGNLVR